MNSVAVIILNWNGKHLLEKFLPGLIENTKIEGCRIVVADNNSSDNSVSFVKEKFPEVDLICFDKNHGFAEGYNKAIEIVKEEYVVLLNSDVEVSENWLPPLIETLKNKEKAAAVMPKILDYKKKEFFEYAGAAGGYMDKFGFTYCRGRIFDNIEKDAGQYDTCEKVFWVSGACFCTRRELYVENGGLDKDFFAHMEEIDLCWRFLSRGYELYCEPESIVYHVGGASLPVNNPKKTFLNFRNNLFLLYKNLEKDSLYKILIFRLFMDGIAAGKFLLSFEFDNFFAVLDAHIDFYSKLSKMKSKRKDNLKKAIKNKHEVIYKGSIVYDFFVGKKKEFSNLKKNNE